MQMRLSDRAIEVEMRDGEEMEAEWWWWLELAVAEDEMSRRSRRAYVIYCLLPPPSSPLALSSDTPTTPSVPATTDLAAYRLALF